MTKPEAPEKPNEEETEEMEKPEDKPDANKSPGVWPPPVPTHPPNHTPATHPPWITGGVAGGPIAGVPIAGVPVAPAATKPTTKRPSVATTWPTRPPVFQWPPTTTPSPALPTPQSCQIVQQRKKWSPSPNTLALSLIQPLNLYTVKQKKSPREVRHMSSWDVARLTVQLGDHNIRSATEVVHKTRHVKRVVRHRGFDSRTLYDDIALLTLDRPVTFSSSIRPICLPPSNDVRSYNGKTAVAIGWGSLRE
uniref:Peptidase S1 domain-containing protein n=2 Tax=Lutzomyia longipalpis TaxID=7200 RepID=A0A1B0CKI9_LUTLO